MSKRLRSRHWLQKLQQPTQVALRKHLRSNPKLVANSSSNGVMAADNKVAVRTEVAAEIRVVAKTKVAVAKVVETSVEDIVNRANQNNYHENNN